MNYKKIKDKYLNQHVHRTNSNRTGELVGVKGTKDGTPEDQISEAYKNNPDFQEGLDKEYKKDLKKQFGDSADKIYDSVKDLPEDEVQALLAQLPYKEWAVRLLLKAYKSV